MSALIIDNPEYSKVRLIEVDWDIHRKHDIVKKLRIPRHGTLVMFNKGEEVERLISQTSRDVIDSMFRSVMQNS